MAWITGRYAVRKRGKIAVSPATEDLRALCPLV